MSDDPKPPILLCSLIAFATLAISIAVLWLHTDRSEKLATAVISAAPRDLSQVIELKQIYSKPPEQEDPSKYPKLPDSTSHKRGPAKITQ